MSDDHEYDEEAARRELAVYRTEPAAERRALVRRQLDLGQYADREGEATVVSVGCGPGFEPAELADELGAEGRVLGVDASPAMLSLAAKTCADRPTVDLGRGDATSLPLADDAADALTAVQVLEYLLEPEAALAEFARVLRPGGRAVVLDTDWRTFVWRADDDRRSQAVLDAWEGRCPNPRIGSALAPHLRKAGLTLERVEPFTIVDRTLEDSFFGHNLPFVADHARDHPDLGPDVAASWERDVREREERGETFVSLTQYCYVVER